MSKAIGRKVSIGIGKESSRGTAVAPSFWFPKMDLSIDDKINVVVDDSSLGIIEDAQSQDITSTYSEGTISGRVYGTSFGLILLATLGTETSHSTVTTGTYDHIFDVNESAQHPSLTFSLRDPNDGGGLQYTLGMINDLELDFEIGKYLTYKAGFRANANASGAQTASFSAENGFRPQDAVIKFASSLSGLSGASAINIKKGTLHIKKNVEDDIVLGSTSAVDRLNKAFSVEGTLELLYNERTYIDTDLNADLAQALRIQFINTSVTIGSASNPTITIDLAKVKFSEVARKMANNELIHQTIKFKAFYSISDSKMITATLKNVQSGAY